MVLRVADTVSWYVSRTPESACISSKLHSPESGTLHLDMIQNRPIEGCCDKAGRSERSVDMV